MPNKEELKKQTLQFLKENHTAVLATASQDGEPHVATMYYAIDDDFTFYFITTSQSKKFANLKDNNRVAITVGTGPSVITVQCGGQAQIIDHAKNNEEAMQIIQKLSQNIHLEKSRQWPVLTLPKTGYGIFKVKPSWMVWLNMDLDAHTTSYEEDFHKIIP